MGANPTASWIAGLRVNLSHVAAYVVAAMLYGLAGVVFLGALAFRQNLVKAVMREGGLELPEPVWTKLAVAWGVFFIFKGTLNLWVAYNFSTDVWVNFKLFGGMGLLLLFVIAQAIWLSRYLQDEPAKVEPPKP